MENTNPEVEVVETPEEVVEEEVSTLFGDDEEVEHDSTEPEVVEPKVSNQKLKIKYNGAEEELDFESQYDDIVSLVQKGKNYDHILSERDSLKNSPELEQLKDIANQVGVKDVSGLVAKLKQDIHEGKVNERVKELVDEELDESHAKRLAELELKVATKEVEQPKEPEPQEEELTNQKDMFVELFNEYPELIKLKYEDYPKDVIELIEQGKPPLVAYQKHLLEQSKQEQAKLQHQSDVKKRNVGSLKSSKAEEKDDFLAMFNQD